MCKLVLIVQPSSATAEWVFSLLGSSFSHKQNTSLEDYVSLSVMLQHNNKVYNIIIYVSVFIHFFLSFLLFNMRIMGLLNGNNGLNF